MSNKSRETRYTDEFEQHFDDTIKYLKERSPKTAKEFVEELKIRLNKIESHPTANPPELSLPSKQNWFRFAIVKTKWKIVFKVTNKLLVFLGIIHTSRHPREIKKLRKGIKKK